MRNLNEIINRFNAQFGHKGKINCSCVGNNKLYFKIRYADLPVDVEKVTKFKNWNGGHIGTAYNCIMCVINIEYDSNGRPKFALGHHPSLPVLNSIYTNSFLMPDYELAQKVSEICQHDSECGTEYVYIPGRLIEKFIAYCSDQIKWRKEMISSTQDFDQLKEHAEEIIEKINIIKALQLEMKCRTELDEKQKREILTEFKFNKLYKKYGIDNKSKTRHDLTEEEEHNFVNDCFDTYEYIGFADTFDTKYDDNKKYAGMKFTVIDRVKEVTEDKDGVDLECLPLWNIRFENGDVIVAYPEEICLAER